MLFSGLLDRASAKPPAQVWLAGSAGPANLVPGNLRLRKLAGSMCLWGLPYLLEGKAAG